MFQKDLKVGWRNIWKTKLFSFINMGGISIAIAVTALILFWIVDEMSYDKFHTNIDRIYTAFEHQQYSDGQELYTCCTPPPLAGLLISEYPQQISQQSF